MNDNQSLYPFDDVSKLIKQKRYNLATKQGYISLLGNMAIMIALILISFSKIFLITIANGTDMYPAILDGDILLGYRLEKNYIKNDVVVCEINGEQIIGRVVAKEGDSVNITEDGKLFVNGTEQIGEIAFPTFPKEQTYPYIVPERCIYILGDYRTNTTDSRNFGSVQIEDVKAEVISILRKRGI